MEQSEIYCQNCRSRNDVRQTHCERCGTRLLLVVFPASIHYDTNQAPTFYEDHLLERISTLELRVAQLEEKLAMVGSKRSSDRRTKRVPKKDSKQSESPDVRESALIARLVAAHDHPNADLLRALLGESLRLAEAGEERESFRMLDRAILISPRNRKLLLFGAVRAFVAERDADAVKYLDQVLRLESADRPALMMRALVAADQRDFALFDEIVGGAGNLLVEFPVLSFVQALVLVVRGQLSEAMSTVRQLIDRGSLPEFEYLLGSIGFDSGDLLTARAGFFNAAMHDRSFTDAWFMLGTVLRRLNDTQALEMLERARTAGDTSPQCMEYLVREIKLPRALPFIHLNSAESRLWSGGSVRFARFIRQAVQDLEEKDV